MFVLQVQVVPAALATNHIHVIQQLVTPAVAIAGGKQVRVFVFFKEEFPLGSTKKNTTHLA